MGLQWMGHSFIILVLYNPDRVDGPTGEGFVKKINWRI